MGFLIFIAVVVLVGLAWVFRVPLLAKVLGQPEDRIRRQIRRKKD